VKVTKVLEIKLSYVYLVLLILMVWPLISPFALPTPISPYTKEVYDIIENLPEGANVLFVVDVPPSGWPAIGPGAYAMAEHLFRRPVKVFFVTFLPLAPPLIDDIIEHCPSAKEKEYGVDYINLGFVAGAEVGIAAFAADIKGVVSTDFKYSKPLDEWPIMKDIKNIEDFELICEPTSAITYMEYLIRQVLLPYDVPIVSIPPFVDIPWAENYYRVGQLKGYIRGTSGIADYERLLGYTGDGTKATAVMTTTHMFAICLLTIGNISFVITKYIKREGGKMRKNVP